MNLRVSPLLWILSFLCLTSGQLALGADRETEIRMPATPSVSPDGSSITFSWLGEIWTAGTDGSDLRRLTNHPALDSQPLYSPDGEEIAFVSRRTGASQIFLMSSKGAELRQVTYHTAGYTLSDWFPDGDHLLALGSRDHAYRDATRMIKINARQREAEQILVDAMVESAKISPDGTQVLFTREGERWWRKGYEGERSSQVWQYDLESGKFKELLHEGVECMWPLWMPDGRGFYYTRGTLNGFELWRSRMAKKKSKPKQRKVVAFEDDSIVYPSISRDGSVIVFRHLFDLYRFRPGKDKKPVRIELQLSEDVDLPDDELRREFRRASEVAFSDDGLEIALVAGGDLWVMDTKLKEPVRVTESSGYEQDVVFSPDGESVWFTLATDGQVDLWKATRGDESKYWWQNEEFSLEQVTDDRHVESEVHFLPGGEEIVFGQGRGNVVVMDVESGKKRTLIEGFSTVDFDVSADGHWLAYAQQDNDFNSDIWIRDVAGEREPVNVSRHPDNESSPRFSADGRVLAFTGRRIDQEVDIYYLYLQNEFDDETSRDRRLEEAVKLMEKKRKKAAGTKKAEATSTSNEQSKKDAKEDDDGSEDADEEASDKAEGDKESADPIKIDFDRIHERLRRISIPDSFERGLFFAPEGAKLVFSSSIDGKSGWYTVEFPDELTPKLLSSSTGSRPRWTKEAGAILYAQNGVPARMEPSGKQESYGFEAAHNTSRSSRLLAGFHAAWLTMREVWYDDRFANRNWEQIRRKYSDAASRAHNERELGQVIELMLGELNGSHLGFYPSSSGSASTSPGDWVEETAHLGVRFDPDHRGAGLKVKDVLMDGPADRDASRILPGDVITMIDGTAVDSDFDLTQVLNGRLDREIQVAIQRDAEDEEQELKVNIRPISYGRARSLLYEHWLEHNRNMVDKQSDGKLGYLHIRAMSMGSFYEFERQLYNVGYGREGLVIDVRDNGGGSTTDRLLTALTQPRHAITVPRGGGQGYPHDRAVYASWSKPIIVLCNQNSYSNAEIFSHAIKTLGRGQVVGVRTAGGVVSTGAASIHDMGTIRVPFRGWFVLGDGQDMERNGCIPHVTIWPKPGELPRGKDRQLEKAVELLVEEVGEGRQDAELTYAAERDDAD